MPNPQVHAAVGMIGALIIFGILYPILTRFCKKNKERLILFLPLIIIVGALLSMVPDIPELSSDYPGVFEPLHVERHDKSAWNTPIFNLCFLHPYLDSKYPERYDNIGLVLTLCVYNGIALSYFYIAKKEH